MLLIFYFCLIVVPSLHSSTTVAPLAHRMTQAAASVTELQRPLLTEPAPIQPKVSLHLTTVFFLAGSKQGVGLCVSSWPMWRSLLRGRWSLSSTAMTCWAASFKAEHQVLRLLGVCGCMCLCVCVCAYMQECVLEITVWIKKSTQWGN